MADKKHPRAGAAQGIRESAQNPAHRRPAPRPGGETTQSPNGTPPCAVKALDQSGHRWRTAVGCSQTGAQAAASSVMNPHPLGDASRTADAMRSPAPQAVGTRSWGLPPEIPERATPKCTDGQDKTGRLEGLHKDLHLTETEKPLAIPFTRKPIRLTQVAHPAGVLLCPVQLSSSLSDFQTIEVMLCRTSIPEPPSMEGASLSDWPPLLPEPLGLLLHREIIFAGVKSVKNDLTVKE